MKRSDADGVSERLRRALMVELSEIKEGVDMSEVAVTQRIRDLCEMSSLCLMLGEATQVTG